MPGGKRLNNINALHLCNSQPFATNDITVSVLVCTDEQGADPLVPAHFSKALDRGIQSARASFLATLPRALEKTGLGNSSVTGI